MISDSVVRASVFRGYEAKWSPDGRIAYVPLRPDPPLEVSDTGDDTPVDANEPDPGQAPPLVFYSGTENEATAKTGGAKSGDDRAFMLAHYNDTLAALEIGRAPWRESVCKYWSISGVCVSQKKKKKQNTN